jgi:hypothetical protein
LKELIGIRKEKQKSLQEDYSERPATAPKQNSAFGREPTVLVVGVNNPPAA